MRCGEAECDVISGVMNSANECMWEPRVSCPVSWGPSLLKASMARRRLLVTKPARRCRLPVTKPAPLPARLDRHRRRPMVSRRRRHFLAPLQLLQNLEPALAPPDLLVRLSQEQVKRNLDGKRENLVTWVDARGFRYPPHSPDASR